MKIFGYSLNNASHHLMLHRGILTVQCFFTVILSFLYQDRLVSVAPPLQLHHRNISTITVIINVSYLKRSEAHVHLFKIENLEEIKIWPGK
jgi:hypothetical protein